MLTLSYQRSTVVLKRKYSTFEKGNALSTMFGFLLPGDAQQCIISALIIAPLLVGPPDIPRWRKQLQRLHSELIGMKKRSVPWCWHEHINTVATPSQPATVKVTLTMWFQNMEFKGWTGISHREHLPYHKGFVCHKTACPRNRRYVKIPFLLVTLTTSLTCPFLLKIWLNSVHL